MKLKAPIAKLTDKETRLVLILNKKSNAKTPRNNKNRRPKTRTK
jgi:hypothetical protein